MIPGLQVTMKQINLWLGKKKKDLTSDSCEQNSPFQSVPRLQSPHCAEPIAGCFTRARCETRPPGRHFHRSLALLCQTATPLDNSGSAQHRRALSDCLPFTEVKLGAKKTTQVSVVMDSGRVGGPSR